MLILNRYIIYITLTVHTYIILREREREREAQTDRETPPPPYPNHLRRIYYSLFGPQTCYIPLFTRSSVYLGGGGGRSKTIENIHGIIRHRPFTNNDGET